MDNHLKQLKIKRFIDCYVPVTTCNFRCSYCYITQQKEFDNALPTFKHTPEEMATALSSRRLGGTCVINLCGGGETLLPTEMPAIIRALLQEGHVVMVVTNGSITKRFEEIAQFPKDLLDRLFIKFSFHYLELVRMNLLDVFFNNVNKIREAGASITLEITPHDELIAHIEDIKKISMEKVGAYPHITVARSYLKEGLPILTELSREEYKKTWGVFNSDLFDYKLSIFGKKRKEFCYAGDWTVSLNIDSGSLIQCYVWGEFCNIYDNIDKPIPFEAIGRNCRDVHCYNGHAFLVFGAIPQLKTGTDFVKMRNRITKSHQEWLSPSVKQMFSSTFIQSNKPYSELRKLKCNMKYSNNSHIQKIYQMLKKFINN